MENIKRARIAYTGEALDNGNMEIRDLAPALLAFASLVEHANKAIGGEQKIRVLLNQDSIKKGSFDITFLLETSILEQAKLFLSNADNSGLTALMTVMGWGVTAGATGKGVFELIKIINGKTIKKINPQDEKKSQIVLENETIVVDNLTLKVYMDVDCRKDIERIVKPLEEEGIDGFELRDPEKVDKAETIVRVGEVDKKLYSAPPAKQDDEMLEEEEQEMHVKIISVNFEMGKWRLSDGTNQFWATVQDEEFRQNVLSGHEAFSNGDVLKIRYVRKQFIKAGNLTTEYIILKVLSHRKTPQTIQLDFE